MGRIKAQCGILAWLIAALGVVIIRPAIAAAADSPTVMSVTLNAGEQYTIDNVSATDTAAVKVVSNPQAMVVHNETPGKIIIVGAAAGEWKIDVKTTKGDAVTYDVTINAAANPYAISSPSTAPPPIVGTGKTTGEAAPVTVTKMDTPAPSSDSGSSSSASSASSSDSSSITSGGMSTSSDASGSTIITSSTIGHNSAPP